MPDRLAGGMRKMTKGTLGGQSRIATLRRGRQLARPNEIAPAGASTPVPTVPACACPYLIGLNPIPWQYLLMTWLNQEGDEIYVGDGVFDTDIHVYSFPDLVFEKTVVGLTTNHIGAAAAGIAGQVYAWVEPTFLGGGIWEHNMVRANTNSDTTDLLTTVNRNSAITPFMIYDSQQAVLYTHWLDNPEDIWIIDESSGAYTPIWTLTSSSIPNLASTATNFTYTANGVDTFLWLAADTDTHIGLLRVDPSSLEETWYPLVSYDDGASQYSASFSDFTSAYVSVLMVDDAPKRLFKVTNGLVEEVTCDFDGASPVRDVFTGNGVGYFQWWDDGDDVQIWWWNCPFTPLEPCNPEWSFVRSAIGADDISCAISFDGTTVYIADRGSAGAGLVRSIGFPDLSGSGTVVYSEPSGYDLNGITVGPDGPLVAVNAHSDGHGEIRDFSDNVIYTTGTGPGTSATRAVWNPVDSRLYVMHSPTGSTLVLYSMEADGSGSVTEWTGPAGVGPMNFWHSLMVTRDGAVWLNASTTGLTVRQALRIQNGVDTLVAGSTTHSGLAHIPQSTDVYQTVATGTNSSDPGDHTVRHSGEGTSTATVVTVFDGVNIRHSATTPDFSKAVSFGTTGVSTRSWFVMDCT